MAPAAPNPMMLFASSPTDSARSSPKSLVKSCSTSLVLKSDGFTCVILGPHLSINPAILTKSGSSIEFGCWMITSFASIWIKKLSRFEYKSLSKNSETLISLAFVSTKQNPIVLPSALLDTFKDTTTSALSTSEELNKSSTASILPGDANLMRFQALS